MNIDNKTAKSYAFHLFFLLGTINKMLREYILTSPVTVKPIRRSTIFMTLIPSLTFTELGMVSMEH